ncbi:MAG: T9SS type A sorting domain-containing protein [Bacteroidia bacterium]|nr:T9SS type A sorting domain-containing protein [Bacteroidia bacterium]
MKTLLRIAVLGYWLASHQLQAQCDSLRLAFRGRWHFNNDTLYIDGGFLTAYPTIGSGVYSGTYIWYWHLSHEPAPGASYLLQSGSLSGQSPTLNVPLNYSAHPTYYSLTLIAVAYSPSGTFVCTDSSTIVIRGDTFSTATNPWRQFCADSVFLLIGGNSVQPNRTITLPLGTYAFDMSPRDAIHGWRLGGPSGPQSGPAPNPPNASPIGTIYLTSPGLHELAIPMYYSPCLIDTFRYYIQAVGFSFPDTCAGPAVQPCYTQLIINNASYLPVGVPINLAAGSYTFYLASADPLSFSPPPICNYSWRLCSPTLPQCLEGEGSTFSAYISQGQYTLTVISRCTWLCIITQACTDTIQFSLKGGAAPNDSVIVYYPGDSTVYTPGDTIALPVDTICLYAGVQVPHPDSLYWWSWTYYGPNGLALDSGITPVSCFSATQAGVYWITYEWGSPPNGRTAQQGPYTFYLKFGDVSTSLAQSNKSSPTLSPNPTTNPATLLLPYRIPYTVSVWEVTGREIWRTTLEGGQTYSLPIYLPRGVYLVRVETASDSYTLRLVME